MNKPKLSEKNMLSVKFYRNLRRNLFYGIYEVNKEVKKKLQHQCPIIKYYENTKYALNRKVTKKNPHNCHVFKFFT
jgi:hypothetical protein